MYYTTKISKFRHLAKRKAPWSESRGTDRFRSLSRRLRLAATGRGTRSAVLGHVVRTDVDGLGGGLFHELDAGGLGMGFGDCFDNQLLPDAEYYLLSKDCQRISMGFDYQSVWYI